MNLQHAFITLGIDFLLVNEGLDNAYEKKIASYDIDKYVIQSEVLKNRFASRIAECQAALTVIKNFDADNSSYVPTDFFDLKVVYQRSLLNLTSNIDELESPALYHNVHRLIRGYAVHMEMAKDEEELQELFKNAEAGIKELKSQSNIPTGLGR